MTFERFLAQSKCAQGWWDVCGTHSQILNLHGHIKLENLNEMGPWLFKKGSDLYTKTSIAYLKIAYLESFC